MLWTENRVVRRIGAVAGSAIFLVLAPGTVVGYLPWLISGWRVHATFPGFVAIRVVGAVLIATGLPVLLESFGRFALQGFGTPAPIFPTQHLVVTGFYRYVRNPMYVALVAMVVGQGLLFGNFCLIVYALTVGLITHAFVRAYEEPTLRRSFGAEYEEYCAHVGRWIPRLTPWNGSEN